MKQIKSLLLGSLIQLRAMSPLPATASIPMPTHMRGSMAILPLGRKAILERMTVKELRVMMTARKIKGRSKIVRKADIIAALMAK